MGVSSIQKYLCTLCCPKIIDVLLSPLISLLIYTLEEHVVRDLVTINQN
jgi:hypothetical protein